MKQMDGLSLVNVSFLGNGPYNLAVQPGECIGLTGRSGVGKTQLLRAVTDVIAHDGECFLNGTSCLDLSPPKWRTMVAMVPAESFWWYDTVAPHFELGKVTDYSMKLLETLGFSPDVMSWQISRLSTGERQRLALVRTLVTRPKVLLLDEPTASLDKKMEQIVEQLLADIFSQQKVACIWVSHDMEQLSRVAGKVIRIEQHGFSEEIP